MVGFLKELFCAHKFELEDTAEVYEYPSSKRPYKIIKTFMCKKCGKIKKLEIC